MHAPDSESGEQLAFERLLFFSDAVFAIAITLLVIEIHVPELPHAVGERELGFALLRLLPRIIGFLVSFFLIGQAWIEHHRIGQQLRRFDVGLLWKNLFVLLFVALMPFTSAVLSEHSGSPLANCVYATSLAGLGLAKANLWRHAVVHQLLGPASEEASRIGRRVWATPLVAVAVAIAGGLGLPYAVMGLPLIPVAASLLDRRKRQPKLSPAA